MQTERRERVEMHLGGRTDRSGDGLDAICTWGWQGELFGTTRIQARVGERTRAGRQFTQVMETGGGTIFQEKMKSSVLDI